MARGNRSPNDLEMAGSISDEKAGLLVESITTRRSDSTKYNADSTRLCMRSRSYKSDHRCEGTLSFVLLLIKVLRRLHRTSLSCACPTRPQPLHSSSPIIVSYPPRSPLPSPPTPNRSSWMSKTPLIPALRRSARLCPSTTS